MLHLHAHGFVDGAYLRALAKEASHDLVNPLLLVNHAARQVQNWGVPSGYAGMLALTRVTYYDAQAEDESKIDPCLQDYWRQVELLPDTHLGFGTVRGAANRKTPRQKGVDTLLAVDMLVGAFTKIFNAAILVAGDADFVPVVQEVRRRGVMVALVGTDRAADDLRRAADRFVRIGTGPGMAPADFPSLIVGDRTWRL